MVLKIVNMNHLIIYSKKSHHFLGYVKLENIKKTDTKAKDSFCRQKNLFIYQRIFNYIQIFMPIQLFHTSEYRDIQIENLVS